MRALVLSLALLIAGCSAHMRAGSNTSAASGGGLNVQVHSPSLAAVIVAGMFIAAAAEDAREPRRSPSFATFNDWFFPPRAPELAPDRPINEQDCTRPVELSGNLKCR